MADILYRLERLFWSPFPLFILTCLFCFMALNAGEDSNGKKQTREASPTSWWDRWGWIFKAVTAILALLAALVAFVKS